MGGANVTIVQTSPSLKGHRPKGGETSPSVPTSLTTSPPCILTSSVQSSSKPPSPLLLPPSHLPSHLPLHIYPQNLCLGIPALSPLHSPLHSPTTPPTLPTPPPHHPTIPGRDPMSGIEDMGSGIWDVLMNMGKEGGEGEGDGTYVAYLWEYVKGRGGHVFRKKNNHITSIGIYSLPYERNPTACFCPLPRSRRPGYSCWDQRYQGPRTAPTTRSLCQ